MSESISNVCKKKWRERTGQKLDKKRVLLHMMIDPSSNHQDIDHFCITAIWPGDRIRRPEHPIENEVRRRSCDESV